MGFKERTPGPAGATWSPGGGFAGVAAGAEAPWANAPAGGQTNWETHMQTTKANTVLFLVAALPIFSLVIFFGCF
jgi:hypothetical protein